ncbi:hypothetical protein N8940_01985 [Sphingomonadaceae bacterium]|nr:hypothetical protein [Sphingomonadaceae bacterium]
MHLNTLICASAAALFLLAQAAQAKAQEESEAETVPQAQPVTNTIIITGESEDERQVLAGSRIARRPVFVDGPVATSTGTRGLVPQSGMDQAGTYVTKRTKRDCVSQDADMSFAAACLMADAQEAYAAGELADASERYAVISGAAQFAPAERLEAARWQYRIAQESDDAVAREAALLTMVATGAMDEAKEKSARRGLVAMALKRGDRAGALQRLIALDEAGMAEARSLANLAILSREAGSGHASETMARAIALTEAAGSPAPQSWQDFTKAE